MDMSSVNWIAVIICVVLGMIIGAIWFSPKVFYTIWRKGIGKSETEMRMAQGGGPMLWILTVLAAFVEATALAFLLPAMNATGIGGGAAAGFMIWLGFIAPTNLVNKLFAGHGLKVWAIEAGN